ncbi:chromate transporter [Spiroplasma endosymbiont of Clivina fossor]|uniref:chromate transporter n=1 Tax=Spiroplasma endosymbiont of Clivina fossor TaxID=3066282 RepID=UPI00313B3623
MTIILTIVLCFFKNIFFDFGGGNAVIPLIKNEVVVKKRWITEDEFNHLLILANTIPGPSIFQVSASVGFVINSWYYWSTISIVCCIFA